MPKYNEQEFKGVCLKGDYNKVIAHLLELDDGDELLKKYKDIFENGLYFLEAKDERIVDFLHRYEDYLKWALSNEATTQECKEYLINKLKLLFPRVNFYMRFSKSLAWVALFRAVNVFFKKRGYFVAFGIVAPYPNMSLWYKQTTRKEIVELPEGKVEIDVCEMDEVITRGWLDYLSMNKIGTGGWVTKKGCTYFKSVYDTDSDEFKVSLLKHEGQHFFDSKKYPKMKSTDLEYRAKLVELIYHKDEMKTFFNFMEQMASEDDRAYPHAYAERKIMQGLSHKLFGCDLELNRDLWVAKGEEIPHASLVLLKEHSEKMTNWDGKSFVI